VDRGISGQKKIAILAETVYVPISHLMRAGRRVDSGFYNGVLEEPQQDGEWRH